VAGHEGTPIRTPDQRVRVFVSSTLGELAREREAVRGAIEGLRLTPVMFEVAARPPSSQFERSQRRPRPARAWVGHRGGVYVPLVDDLTARLRDSLSNAEYEAARVEGGEWTLTEALDRALAPLESA
jgi:Domain of unknown function (DUF4062)